MGFAVAVWAVLGPVQCIVEDFPAVHAARLAVTHPRFRVLMLILASQQRYDSIMSPEGLGCEPVNQ